MPDTKEAPDVRAGRNERRRATMPKKEKPPRKPNKTNPKAGPAASKDPVDVASHVGNQGMLARAGGGATGSGSPRAPNTPHAPKLELKLDLSLDFTTPPPVELPGKRASAIISRPNPNASLNMWGLEDLAVNPQTAQRLKILDIYPPKVPSGDVARGIGTGGVTEEFAPRTNAWAHTSWFYLTDFTPPGLWEIDEVLKLRVDAGGLIHFNLTGMNDLATVQDRYERRLRGERTVRLSITEHELGIILKDPKLAGSTIFYDFDQGRGHPYRPGSPYRFNYAKPDAQVILSVEQLKATPEQASAAGHRYYGLNVPSVKGLAFKELPYTRPVASPSSPSGPSGAATGGGSPSAVSPRSVLDGAAKKANIQLSRFKPDKEGSSARIFKDLPALQRFVGMLRSLGVQLLLAKMWAEIAEHFDTILFEAAEEFRAVTPAAEELERSSGVAQRRMAYDAAAAALRAQEARHVMALAMVAALTPEQQQEAAFRALDRSPAWHATKSEHLKRYREAGLAYENAMIGLYKSLGERLSGMPPLAEEIRARASVLSEIGEGLDRTFWSLVGVTAISPLVYNEWLQVHQYAQFFKHFGEALAQFAAEIESRVSGYQRLMNSLDERLMTVGEQLNAPLPIGPASAP